MDPHPSSLAFRSYGCSGPRVVLLHGGPGAPGYLGPLARSLAKSFRVLEPFQRPSGTVPLTVALHIDDLHDFLLSYPDDPRPALVGHSWGAMLALAYAAEHPDFVGPLVLIGCGTFDPHARAHLHEIIDQRMTPDLRRALRNLEQMRHDPNERLLMTGKLLEPVYSFDSAHSPDESLPCDIVAHEQTWADMVRLQAEGVYPAVFSKIHVPVLMIHGSHDPHPGSMIRDGLRPFLPQLEYLELDHCGHYPWLERFASENFLKFIGEWLPHHAS